METLESGVLSKFFNAEKIRWKFVERTNTYNL